MPVDNEIYDRIGWWDESHPIASLRFGLNPARFAYFKTVLTAIGRDARGSRALDIGCGGGYLAEEFARIGCRVTGIDPSVPTLKEASDHARRSGLQIEYMEGAGENMSFSSESFDIVYCCDVLEHVRDLDRVVSEVARVLMPGGVFFYDTINRTLVSRILLIKVMQEWKFTRIYETNLHDWDMFIKPSELKAVLGRNGLENVESLGLAPTANPLTMMVQLRRAKKGKMSFAEFGRRSAIKPSRDLNVVYAGYALKK